MFTVHVLHVVLLCLLNQHEHKVKCELVVAPFNAHNYTITLLLPVQNLFQSLAGWPTMYCLLVLFFPPVFGHWTDNCQYDMVSVYMCLVLLYSGLFTELG